MTKDRKSGVARPGSTAPGQEIVVHSRRDLDGMSDDELLGADYGQWLAEEKRAVQGTIEGGEKARAAAERAIRRAEDAIRRAKARNGR